MVPCDFCKDIKASTEAWLDFEFLVQYFPSSLALLTPIEALHRARRV